MRRLCTALLMFASSAFSAQAQASFTIADFVTTDHGFTATFLFRNENRYGDPTMIGLDNNFRVNLSQRVQDRCLLVGIGCVLDGFYAPARGPVQTDEFYVKGALYQPEIGYSGIGCASNMCLGQTFISGYIPSFLLGCQVPYHPFAALPYAGRTCDADGFTGSFAVDLHFGYTLANDELLNLTPNDIEAVFQTTVLATVPEPSTYALVTLGLIGVGVVARRRRLNS